MAGRTVKLKPDKPAPGPAIRLRRSEDGFGFSVESVDKNGTADFRTEAVFSGYDEALKEAQAKAQHHRLPLKNETGVVEPESVEKTAKRSAADKAGSLSRRASQTKDLPLVEAQFRLPNVDARLADVDMTALVERAFATFSQERDEYLNFHADAYGESRDHTVTFSQKTYDQIQGQIRAMYLHALSAKAILYAHLERAFELIEQLEQSPKGMTYRGVYKADEQYVPGDVCTWSGSAWHCNEPTTERPDAGPWTLCVKRGRDGKDLRHATSA